MNATKESRKMVNVNLSLSIADYEWFEAYAKVTGKTFSEAASKGLALWLGTDSDYPVREGWLHIQDLLDQAASKSLTAKEGGEKESQQPSNLIVFPGR